MTDACESGHASVKRTFHPGPVSKVGEWQERWRYKHTGDEEGKVNPRIRAEALLDSSESPPCADANLLFPEVPRQMVSGSWELVHQTRLFGYEGMHLKEARGLLRWGSGEVAGCECVGSAPPDSR